MLMTPHYLKSTHGACWDLAAAGVPGAALGFPDDVLLRMAGWAQTRAQTSAPGWNGPLGSPPYGDDPKDQIQIQQGIRYFKCGCYK